MEQPNFKYTMKGSDFEIKLVNMEAKVLHEALGVKEARAVELYTLYNGVWQKQLAKDFYASSVGIQDTSGECKTKEELVLCAHWFSFAQAQMMVAEEIMEFIDRRFRFK